MHQQSLISIIIPTYNRAHLIGETLDSIVAQTYTNWECIVVDDGSTDKTNIVLAAYCEKDKRFKYLKRPDNYKKGGNGARNYGFEISKGDYINWFDSDDIMHPEKLEIQYNLIKQTNSNFVTCQSIVFKNNISNLLKLNSESIFSENIFSDYLTKKVSWLTQAPLWSKLFLSSLDYLFDENLRAGQEWEFHSRVLLNYPDYSYTNERLVYIRQHDSSISYSKKAEVFRDINYVKARILIYNLLKNAKRNINDRAFLSEFILFYFTKFLINKDVKSARFILCKFILIKNDLAIKRKTILILSYLSYLIFGKGYVFLSKSK
tara:strand:- start:134769 stop:135725 length:957 start_codon:yes stop_codon:yes gene_type:complete